MTVAKIHGAEYPIRKIFSNDFNFKIPLYQRPYSWTTEQAEELFNDLISFIGSDKVHGFWFGLKRTTKETLETHPNAYCAFGLGSPDCVVAFPFRILGEHLEHLDISPDKDGCVRHWHIQFRESFGHMELLLAPKTDNIDVTEFLLGHSGTPYGDILLYWKS